METGGIVLNNFRVFFLFFLAFFFIPLPPSGFFGPHSKGKVRARSQDTHAEEILRCGVGRICTQRFCLDAFTHFGGQSATLPGEPDVLRR